MKSHLNVETSIKPRRVIQHAGPPVYQYVGLTLLLLVAGTVQALLVRDVLHETLHPESVYVFPFSINPTTAIITSAGSGRKAGLKEGDLLISLDGTPYTGTHVFDETFAKFHPIPSLAVTVRTPASNGSSVQIPLTSVQAGGYNTGPIILFRMIVYVVMPCFGVILGFWVAAVRPRDPLAWLLLGVMLGFSQLLGFPTGAWGPGIRDLARAYHLIAGNFWSLGMLLFGLYFPEPFPFEGRRWWSWLKWTVIVLFLVCALPDIIVKTIDVERYASVEWLSRLSEPLSTASVPLSVLAVSGFFASIFAKGSMSASPDAKRRLRLLYFGSAIGLAPVFIGVIVGFLKGKNDLGDVLPQWLLFTVLLLLFVFPLTLAYTIVVQRAFDVRVVVRQGLQYTLARSGVGVISVALSVGVAWAAVYMLQHSTMRSPLFYAIIATAVVAGVGFRKFG